MTTFKRNFDFNENIIEIIAQNIRKYRIEKKITQEQLAIDIGVSPEYYRKFESTLGSEGISLTNVYKISVVLGVNIDKFFE
jgi:transcriptional regulator with XRE-family HTH domain